MDQDAIFIHGHKMALWLSTAYSMPELSGTKTEILRGARITSGFGKPLSLQRINNNTSTPIKPSWCYFELEYKSHLFKET